MILFEITARSSIMKSAISGDIISKVQNTKGERFGRII